MGKDQEDIEFYFSEKLAGCISAEDLLYIDTLISQDEGIHQRWLEFSTHFSEEDISSRFSRLDDPKKWKLFSPAQLHRKTTAGKFLSLKYILLYAAAVVTGIFLLMDPAGLFTRKPSGGQPAMPPAVFTLHLADGRVIDLSQSVEDSTPGIHYYAKEQLLSFDAALSPTGNGTLKVPAGKSVSILLSDGSKMMINSATAVTFPIVFDSHKREISINGEIYLDVASDPARPFTVHTSSGAVQVLGTAFNLNAYDPARMMVTLMKGAVKVLTAKNQVTLKPGTTATTDNKGEIRVEQSKDDHAASWTTGIYYFQHSDVNEIKEVLERWYDLRVFIDHPALSDQRFTGAVDRSNDVAVFLDNLTAVTTIKYSIDSAHNVHLQ